MAAGDNLIKLQPEILRAETLFAEERKKWGEENQNRFTDMNEFFVERCKWETEYKKMLFSTLYEQRSILAKDTPIFWLRAMVQQEMIYKMIKQKDIDALPFLSDINYSRTSDPRGFELKFAFEANPYFTNDLLIKRYEVMGDDKSASLKATGTKINWHPSKNLTLDKRGKRCESFFKFFRSYATVDPLSFDIETDMLQGDIPEDYEIGIKFRDTIIPYGILPPVSDEDDDEDDDDDDSDSDYEE